jgi:D-alanyl-lipoteichoic acid acyltransferase DltB (MBOAT superfamily)
MSFYTFKEISYVVDIYRRKLKPEKSFFDFALYVSFFPQLVAGPIERAGEMLPQIKKARKITPEYIDLGLYLVTWGFFKKIVVADNMATISAQVFGNYHHYRGLDIFCGVLAYTIQIYCDFSGYTDIARGISKLMGFDLPLNFRLPYLARSPSDFWNRWHISLSQWLRDYLYVSLGGNRVAEWKIYRNLMITMLLGGLWHGAAWNFVAWGGYHGVILCIYRALGGRKRESGGDSKLKVVASISFMFLLTMIGWVCFNSKSFEQIVYMLSHVGLSRSPETFGFLARLLFYISPLAIVQGFQAYSANLLRMMQMRTYGRIAFQFALLIVIVLFGARQSTEFIYFQF